MSETKKCNACGQTKPLTEFYIRKETGGYKNRCKRCCIDGINVPPKSTTHKICKHCGEEKPISDYQKAGGGQWLQPYCKPCDKARKQKHREENYDRMVARQKQYYDENKEEILRRDREKRAQQPKQPRVFKRMPEEERKRRKSECDRRYREKKREELLAKKKAYNRGRGLEKAKQWQAKMMLDPAFRIKKNLRGRVYVALKRGIKSASTVTLLGCSVDEFIAYFQSLFTEGMTWEEYLAGNIHIDHIKPCKLFDLTKEEEQKACFHYTNLQPLWKIDNLIKGVSYNPENQPYGRSN
jgi:hypothetical protein